MRVDTVDALDRLQPMVLVHESEDPIVDIEDDALLSTMALFG